MVMFTLQMSIALVEKMSFQAIRNCTIDRGCYGDAMEQLWSRFVKGKHNPGPNTYSLSYQSHLLLFENMEGILGSKKM